MLSLKNTYLQIRGDKLDLQRTINKMKLQDKNIVKLDVNIKRFVESYCSSQNPKNFTELEESVDYTVEELKKYKKKYFNEDQEESIKMLIKTIFLRRFLSHIVKLIGQDKKDEYHKEFMSKGQSYYYKFEKEYLGFSIEVNKKKYIFKEKREIIERIIKEQKKFYFLIPDNNNKVLFKTRKDIVNKIIRVKV